MSDLADVPMSWGDDDESESYQVFLDHLVSCIDQLSARSLLDWCLRELSLSPTTFDWARSIEVADLVESRARELMGRNVANCLVDVLQNAVTRDRPVDPPEEIPISDDKDLVYARGAAQELAIRMGMKRGIAVRIATVVSELSRIILASPGRGRIVLVPLASPLPGVKIIATEIRLGPTGRERSPRERKQAERDSDFSLLVTGRLMDELVVEPSAEGGTTVIAVKYV